MTNHTRQRGEGRAGCIFWLAVLAVMILVGVKAVPVKYKSSQLYDFMYEQAKYAQMAKPEQIHRAILRKANELGLPLQKKNLKVERRGDRIRIHATYTVTLEYPGYTYVWDFEEEIDEPIFIW
jgi:hypothetical protein